MVQSSSKFITPEENQVYTSQLNLSFAIVMKLKTRIVVTKRIAVVLALLSAMVNLADGHGRLRDPPSRSSAWRDGLPVPPDYNDTEGFCGGYERQWLVNKGNCGICGDPFDEPIKPHQAPGGTFATGLIVRNYTEGQTILVKIDITALHKGYYEFKLCPNDNVNLDPPQSCFDRFPLTFVNGAPFTKFDVATLTTGKLETRLQLPRGVTCRQCILQWTYTTGNRWGTCSNGTQGLGCGPQEMFRACSDIGIFPREGELPVVTPPTVTEPTTTTMPPMTTSMPITVEPPMTMPPMTTLMPITVEPPMTMPPMTTSMPITVEPPMTMPPMTTSMPVTVEPPATMLPLTTVSPPIVVIPDTTTQPAPVNFTDLPPIIPFPVSTVAPVDLSCVSYIPVPSQQIVPGMTEWCNLNCRLGYCPPTYCICIR